MRFSVFYLITLMALPGCTYTSGKNVTTDQARQFVVGQSTIADVEAKLGQPTSSQTSSTGIEMLQYEYNYTHQDASNYIPIYGLLQTHVEQASNKATFVFSPTGVLQSYSLGAGSNAMSN